MKKRILTIEQIKAQAEHDEKNRKARELLREHDRIINKREDGSHGIRLGIKQW